MSRLVGISRFSSYTAVVLFEQFVGIYKLSNSARRMRIVLHPYTCIFEILRMRHKLPCHNIDVFSRTVLFLFARKSRAIYKQGIIHTEFLSPFVHKRHKGIGTARNSFCKRVRRIVSRYDDYAFYQVVYAVFRSAVKKHLTSAHTCSFGGYANLLVKRKFSLVYGFEYQIGCHYFYHTGNFVFCVSVVRIQYFTAVIFRKIFSETVGLYGRLRFVIVGFCECTYTLFHTHRYKHRRQHKDE